ncbi:AraC-like DNA-binding protein [Mesonia hippocampi]|uniref:AraC-like DNA-binding protein n=1 Tax=Mesonia hippocampi TaxID=1628250 RepID=A0A840EM57_9FLAO|nr:helix-turn-helix transcriptional regulator [Mesonia hippocampi]MBB4119198.1 AraC-like DNA-binding protein [Mesonia hippocampi]
MKTPVLKIEQFKQAEPLTDFYINTIANHINENKNLISKSHKHNFYLCVLFTKGEGIHEIDFSSYPIKPGKVFFLRPGQTHAWKFTSPPEGYIFFHSKEFYELKFLEHKLKSFPFYYSFQNPPVLTLSKKSVDFLQKKYEEIYHEFQHNEAFRALKIVNLINGIYIDLLREYTATINLEKFISVNYLTILENLEQLINTYFLKEKLPRFYADKLSITTKHLNRVVKETISKTTSELIADRILLEAKRMMVHSDESLTNIASLLEFSDYAYFSKIFKAKTGLTPSNFRKKYG